MSTIPKTKNWLAEQMRERNYHVVDGKPGTLLVSLGITAEDFTEYCAKHKVVVKNFSGGAAKYQRMRIAGSLSPSPSPSHDAGDGASLASSRDASNPSAGSSDDLWGVVSVADGSDKENAKFIKLVDDFSKNYAVIFDLDGTLVDTSRSFDATVKELVRRHSGRPLEDAEFIALREEGGFNDDWVATGELLKRRGVDLPFPALVAEAMKLYLELAPHTEFPLFKLNMLDRLNARYRTFIVTGRSRCEYDPIWKEALDPLFVHVYCLDDIAGLRAKPSPDYLLALKEEFGVEYGVYIGNAVDDMRAAQEAGLSRIGLTSTLSAEALSEAGAQIVIDTMDELEQVYSI